MAVLQVYFSLAFIVSLLVWVGHVLPLMHEAKRKGIVNELTKSPYISNCVFIVTTMLLAPFVVVVLFSSERAKYFRMGLRRVIEEAGN